MHIALKYISMDIAKKFSQHEVKEHNKMNLLDLKIPQVVT